MAAGASGQGVHGGHHQPPTGHHGSSVPTKDGWDGGGALDRYRYSSNGWILVTCVRQQADGNVRWPASTSVGLSRTTLRCSIQYWQKPLLPRQWPNQSKQPLKKLINRSMTVGM